MTPPMMPWLMKKRNNSVLPEKAPKHSRLLYFGIALVIVCGIGIVSMNFFRLTLIHGNSMSPTYHNLQLTVLDERPHTYTYGDVIAFRCDGVKGVLIKRIAACPGDSVCIKDGRLLVNGKVSTVYPDSTFEYAGIAEKAFRLPADSYFVIGDNIPESRDSRYAEIGSVPRRQILGVLINSKKPIVGKKK